MMDAKQCMIQLMADIVGPNEAYHDDGLNDAETWERFMAEVIRAMESVGDPDVREALDSIDRGDFQAWIDDPLFWRRINEEIEKRGQVLRTLLPSTFEGRC